MKIKILISLLLSSQLFAGDLIFKNGFENNSIIEGTASGVSSTGLILQLNSGSTTENLAVNQNGSFVFNSYLNIGATWNVTIQTLPSNPELLHCSLSNNSGTMSASGVNTLLVACENASLIWNEGNWNKSTWN